MAIVPLFYINLQRHGGYASGYDLSYQEKHFGAHPQDIRLEQSYETWAQELSGLDQSGYLYAALGFADGRGVATKRIIDGKPQYEPYLWQGGGTPFLIGLVMLAFGSQHVLPYFLIICVLHYLTVVGVVYLASAYTRRTSTLLIIGLLSLLSLPVLNFNFALGLCSSEPLSEFLLVAALIWLQYFWRRGRWNSRQALVGALGFGVLIGLASYVREILSFFGLFCCGGVVIATIGKDKGFKNGVIFAVTACLVLALVQLPWKLRNERVAKEFAMSQSQNCGYAFWISTWTDWRETAKWCPNCGLGWGNFLRPEQSPIVIAALEADKRKGGSLAAGTLVREVLRHPRKAFQFKLAGYDTLWLGERNLAAIRFFCLASLIAFLVFVWRMKRQLPPELWTFPVFTLGLSAIIHYEPRFAHPFYYLITPVAVGLLWEQWQDWRKRRTSGSMPNEDAQVAAVSSG